MDSDPAIEPNGPDSPEIHSDEDILVAVTVPPKSRANVNMGAMTFPVIVN